MEKAYDMKELGKAVLAELERDALPALNLATQAVAKSVFTGAKKWFEASAKMTENKFDDFFIPFLGHLDQFILPQISEIDLSKLIKKGE